MRYTRFPSVVLASLLLIAPIANAQLTPGGWIPALGETARYCVDDACSQEVLDASIEIYESIPLGLLSAEVTISFAPVGFDIPSTYGNTFALEDLPYAVSSNEFDFEFATSGSLILSGSPIVGGPQFGLPVLEVTIDRVEFVPVPEPSRSTMLVASILTAWMASRRPRAA